MAGDLAANSITGRFPDVATHPKSTEAEARAMSPPRKKPADLEEHDTAIYPVRPSQAAVDQVYRVRNMGIGATVLLALLLPGIPGIFWAAPWMAENIWRPKNEAEIAAIKQNADSNRISAEALQLIAKNGNANADVIKAVAALTALIEKRTETEQQIPSILESMSRTLQAVKRRVDELEPRKE